MSARICVGDGAAGGDRLERRPRAPAGTRRWCRRRAGGDRAIETRRGRRRRPASPRSRPPCRRGRPSRRPGGCVSRDQARRLERRRSGSRRASGAGCTSPRPNACSRSRFCTETTPDRPRRRRSAAPTASTRGLALAHGGLPRLRRPLRRALVDHERLGGSITCFRMPSSASPCPRTARRVRSCTGSGRRPPRRSRMPMSKTCASNSVAEPVADEVAHRLDVDLRCEALLDRRDDRELGARSSVSRRGAVSSNRRAFSSATAQARRDRRQDADVRVRERVLAVEVLERDDARRLAADEERDEQGGLRRPRPGGRAAARRRADAARPRVR